MREESRLQDHGRVPRNKKSLHMPLTGDVGISTEPHGESTDIALKHGKLKIIFFLKRK